MESDYAWRRCSHKVDRDIPIIIDDTPALTIAMLYTRVRRLKYKYNVKDVFVDYLQLLHGSEHFKNSNRVNEISEIMFSLFIFSIFLHSHFQNTLICL
mgnify:CR=1 FL=1